MTTTPWPDLEALARRIDALLDPYAASLGCDRTGYGHHAKRVAALCLRQGAVADVEPVTTAAAFHDLGIWTHGTLDYLAPSAELAAAHLDRVGRADLVGAVRAMIAQHHKVTGYQGLEAGLVERFRRADWQDVTVGLRSFGLPRADVRRLYAQWPDAGFHARLLRLALGRAVRHPLAPLPMFRR